MPRYRDPPSRTDRAFALAAVIAVHAALALLVLSSHGAAPPPPAARPLVLLDLRQPPPPPPPPPRKTAATAPHRAAGQAGRKATPLAAPPTPLPPRAALAAAPLPATGSAPTAGAGNAGNGPGAGNAGNGPGGGGNGGSGTGGDGIGEDARLLSGGLDHRDYRTLRSFAAPAGRAVLGLLVGPDGRVAGCSVRQSSGEAALDSALCAMLQPRMRWSPARDRAGRPLTVGIVYTAVWARD